MAYYNIATNGKYRYQDHKRRSPALGGGVSGGYARNISKNKLWRMECSLGIGVYRAYYDRFHNYTNVMLVDTKRKTYFGLDQVNVSIAYSFNLNSKGGAR